MSFFLFLCEFLRDSKECSVFSISAICLPIHLYIYPSSQHLLSNYYVPDLYTETTVTDGIWCISLYLFVFLSFSVLCVFIPLCFSFLFSLKQTLVGLGSSVSVFGKRFDCSVRCYKSLNRTRQICICDPFP